MASVFDVAKYILHKMGRISTWKLQKLCYYSQAWSLAWTGNPLFLEDFEAWSNGPVCRPLFNKHKGLFVVDENSISGDIAALDDDQQDTINIVIEDYGKMQPYELRGQTHIEKPWLDARGDLPEGAYCDEIISKSSMAEYYGAF